MKLSLPWWAYDVTERQDGADLVIRFRVRRPYLAWLGLRALCTAVLSTLSRKVFGR